MSLLAPLCVGIAVSKTTLKMAALTRISLVSVDNDVEGVDEMITALRKQPVALVLLDASGGLEVPVACTLQAEGFDIALITPRQAREFACARGYLTKTDRIDARVLAQMAEAINKLPDRANVIRLLPDAERQILAAIILRRRQLAAMLTVERDRLLLAHPQSRKSVGIIIRALEDELIRIDDGLNRYIKPHCKDLTDRLRSLKGTELLSIADQSDRHM